MHNHNYWESSQDERAAASSSGLSDDVIVLSSSNPDGHPMQQQQQGAAAPSPSQATRTNMEASSQVVAVETPSKLFYKTKLCEKFKSDGCCPYEGNCTFAHGEQDIHPPAPDWQEKQKLFNNAGDVSKKAHNAGRMHPGPVFRPPPPPPAPMVAPANGPAGWHARPPPGGGVFLQPPHAGFHGPPHNQRAAPQMVPGNGRMMKPCFQWMEKGSCAYGGKCTFSHCFAPEMHNPGGAMESQRRRRMMTSSAVPPPNSLVVPSSNIIVQDEQAAAPPKPAPLPAEAAPTAMHHQNKMATRFTKRKIKGIYGDWPEED